MAVIFTVFIYFVILKIGMTKYTFLGLSLLAYGGFGNLIQRVKNGCIIDNLSILEINFNIYDIFIVTGIFVIIIGNYEYFINRR